MPSAGQMGAGLGMWGAEALANALARLSQYNCILLY